MWSWIKKFFSLRISNGYNVIYVNFGGIRDPFKLNLPLQFCKHWNKDVSTLTETSISLDQVHRIIIVGSHLFLFWSHTKGLLVLLHLSLEGITEIDAEVDLCPLRLPSLITVLCALVLSGRTLSGHSCHSWYQGTVG